MCLGYVWRKKKKPTENLAFIIDTCLGHAERCADFLWCALSLSDRRRQCKFPDRRPTPSLSLPHSWLLSPGGGGDKCTCRHNRKPSVLHSMAETKQNSRNTNCQSVDQNAMRCSWLWPTRVDILVWRLLLLQTIWKTFSRWCRNAWQTCFAYLKPSFANTRLSTLWTSWEQLVQSLPRSKVSKRGSAVSQSTFKSIHSRRASQSLSWVLFLLSTHNTCVGVIVHRILWFSLIMSGFKGHKKKCFHFFFSIFFHFSRKHDLSQGYSSFTRFCADDCNFHSFFLWLRETCCSVCLHSGAAHAFVWRVCLFDSSCEHLRTRAASPTF